MASRKDRMTLHDWDNVRVMDLGAMDIWDGADLSLLRETLTQLIEVEKQQHVGVDMQHVKYIPSGFFGMLFDCHERGIEIFLYCPQKNVANMLWFRQFFQHVADGCYVLRDKPQEEFVPVMHDHWKSQSLWDEQKNSESVPAFSREN